MINIDLTIDLDQIDGKFYRILKQMAPFGPQNLQPVFTTEAVWLAQQPIIMKEKHLKLILRQKGSDNTYTAVGFGMAQYALQLSSQQPFSICYQLDENTYNGNTTLQLMLKDIRVAE